MNEDKDKTVIEKQRESQSKEEEKTTDAEPAI